MGVPGVEVYKELYRTYGEDPRSLAVPNEQRNRDLYQSVIERVKLDEVESVLDIGCGFADLHPFIQRRWPMVARYAGVDVVPEFIEVARKRYPELELYVGNFLREPVRSRFDLVAGLGILHTTSEVNRFLKTAWGVTDKALVFNAQSRLLYGGRFRAFHPDRILARALEYTPHVELHHGHNAHQEFLVVMYR